MSCKSGSCKAFRGVSLIETIVTMLLVVIFFTTAYVVLTKITTFAIDVVDPMPMYSVIVTRLGAVKADMDNSLAFAVNGNQINYLTKDGKKHSYDFSQFPSWFPSKYTATASVMQTRADTVVVSWQFTTPRQTKLSGNTVLKRMTNSVPTPVNITSVSNGVLIALYNPATGIGSPTATSATVPVRFPNGSSSNVSAVLTNGIPALSNTAYYGLFVQTASKPIAVYLPSLYGLDDSYTYPVEVSVP